MDDLNVLRVLHKFAYCPHPFRRHSPPRCRKLETISGSPIPSISLHSLVLPAPKPISPNPYDDPNNMGAPTDINTSNSTPSGLMPPPPKNLAEPTREPSTSSQRHPIPTVPRDHCRPQPPPQPRSCSPDPLHVPQSHRSHPTDSRMGDWAISRKRKYAGNQDESSSDGRIWSSGTGFKVRSSRSC
jgi:hypothetical protein